MSCAGSFHPAGGARPRRVSMHWRRTRWRILSIVSICNLVRWHEQAGKKQQRRVARGYRDA